MLFLASLIILGGLPCKLDCAIHFNIGFVVRDVGAQDDHRRLPEPDRPRVAAQRQVLLQAHHGQDLLPHVYHQVGP